MTVSSTHLRGWYTLPHEITPNLFSLLNFRDAIKFSQTNKKTSEFFFSDSVLKDLVKIHFSSELSSQKSINQQYFGLANSRSNNAFPLCNRTLKLPPLGSIRSSFYISEDQKKILCLNDRLVQLIDATTGNCLLTLPTNLSIHDAVHMSGNGTRAVTTEHENVKIWDLTTGKCIETIVRDPEIFEWVHMNHNGNNVVVTFKNGVIKNFDVETNRFLFSIKGHDSKIEEIEVSPDGSMILIGYKDGIIEARDAKTGIKIQTLIHPEPIEHIKCTSENAKIIALNFKGHLTMWETHTGKCLKTLLKNVRGVSLAITPDNTLAISSHLDGNIQIFNLISQKIVGQFKPFEKFCLLSSISQDGTTIIAGNPKSPMSFQFLNIAPLPHERIHFVASLALQNDRETVVKFNDLPSHVKCEVAAYPTTRKRLRDENLKIYERLSQYSIATFIPQIIKFFEDADEEDGNASSTANGVSQFSSLPDTTKTLVFSKLCILHKALGKYPENAPPNYGQMAFNNLKGLKATNRERILAINGTFTTVQEAKQALRKNPL